MRLKRAADVSKKCVIMPEANKSSTQVQASLNLAWRNSTLVLAKLAVTGGSFWLISRQIQPAAVRSLLNTLDTGWLLLAIILIAIEIPLVGERWRLIVNSLGMYRLPGADVQAANGLGQLVGQVLPNLAGDGARALLLRARQHHRRGRGASICAGRSTRSRGRRSPGVPGR